jgi:hypothetical protein
VNTQIPRVVRPGQLAVEAATAGLAFAALLGWASTALVGSFRGEDLPGRYWQPIPVRTDTSGFIAFVVAAICLATSEYLRLRRRRAAPPASPPDRAATVVLAVAETVAVLTTGLFVYLSFNAITHPGSLLLHITHLLPWPAEGTVRIEALVLCACSAAVWRYVRARYRWAPGPVPAWPGHESTSSGPGSLPSPRTIGDREH